jgi:hypothetical protein
LLALLRCSTMCSALFPSSEHSRLFPISISVAF